jgi:hypothetical protein
MVACSWFCRIPKRRILIDLNQKIKLGAWQKYRLTADDYRHYHKRKIVFAGILSRGKMLAGSGRLMLRTYQDMGVASNAQGVAIDSPPTAASTDDSC